jgi:acyl-CoA synthetase (AMP-forming)/AMP-acid ligase II
MPSRIGDALRWHATYTPNKIAIVSPEGTQTYAQLWIRACRLSNALAELGVRPGDRIALLMQNSSRYIEIYQAAALMGVAVVPLNFRFVATEIEYVVNHSGARALIFDRSFADTVQLLRTRLPCLADRYVVTDAPATTTTHSYEALIASGLETPPSVPADLSACYFQGYTSGTTGFPKGCVNPHREFADCLRRIATIYDITGDDRELVAAPLFHEAPALFALSQIFRGGTVIVTSDTRPVNVFESIDRSEATWTFMVPTMWASMVVSEEIDRFDLGSLRLLLSGGSPLLTHTKEALLRRFPNAGLNEFYGATEVGLVTNLRPEDQRRKVRSVGRPVIGMFVELHDEDGNIIPNGEVGEIYIGGATIIREYFNYPEATTEARRGGFFTLGDMGRFDEEGYLYIVDRKKDMIISGGENIFPNDIEEVLYRHPAVEMAAVVGAPDPKWGEIVVAVVTLKADNSVNEPQLIATAKHFCLASRFQRELIFRTRCRCRPSAKYFDETSENLTGNSKK